MPARTLAFALLVALGSLGLSGGSPRASADDPPTPPAAPPAAAPAAAPAGDATPYNAAELRDLVGPVALYPDIVLASLLPATTFPNDVSAAIAYVAKQPGGTVKEVPEEGKAWDQSVQAMLQFPDVLKWLGENKPWVEQMAFAVAVQQSEVMAAIQAFRKETQTAGNLTSNQHQVVSVEDASDGDTEVIVIEPTDPEIVYVPTYDSGAVVAPGYSGWGWGAGVALGVFGAWAFHEMNWGSHGGEINHNRNTTINGGDRNFGDRTGPNRPQQWNASNRPSQRPGGAGSGVNRPSQGGWGQGGGSPRPGGVKPSQLPSNRPGGAGGANRPATRPSTRPGAGASRPSAAPNVPGSRPGGGASRPGGAGGSRPGAGAGGARPKASPSHGFSGAGSGSRARAQSNRGGSSMRSSGGGARGGSYRGQSGRGGGSRGGGGRGGGGRGGGGRGGGGRRR